MAGAVDWTNRYTVRLIMLALALGPERGDETVVAGPPSLAVEDGRCDGRVATKLESPAWSAHGIETPAGAMSLSDALTLAAQTRTTVERSVLQAPVDQLVWAGDEDEIDRCAACLAAAPHVLAENGAGPVDFGRMRSRETVALYLDQRPHAGGGDRPEDTGIDPGS